MVKRSAPIGAFTRTACNQVTEANVDGTACRGRREGVANS